MRSGKPSKQLVIVLQNVDIEMGNSPAIPATTVLSVQQTTTEGPNSFFASNAEIRTSSHQVQRPERKSSEMQGIEKLAPDTVKATALEDNVKEFDGENPKQNETSTNQYEDQNSASPPDEHPPISNDMMTPSREKSGSIIETKI